MKKNLIFVIILLTVGHSFGQKTRAELIFKDGTTLKGFGEPTNVNTIRFKKERKAKKQFFSFEEVDTVKVYHDFEPTIYVLVNIQDKSNSKVLEMARAGKNVVYFRDISQGYTAPMATPIAGGTIMMSGGGFYNTKYSYVRKTNEEKAVFLGSSNWMSKNFKNAASNFFSDCPELVEKIETKKFKKRDLKEIIEFYNTDCN